MRTHAEWNVETHMIRARRPTSASTRSFISAAALFVKVIARIEPGWALRSAISQAIRRVSTRVLPEPAPATTSSGVPAWVTAARCGSLRPSSSSSGDGPRRGGGGAAPGTRPGWGGGGGGGWAWPHPARARSGWRTGTAGSGTAHSWPSQGTSRAGHHRSEQAAVRGPAGQLVPGGQLELAEHARHVGLHGLDRDEELAGHLLVGVAAGDQPHHLTLALGQPVEVLVDLGDLDGAGERVEHEAGEPWREDSVAGGNPLDGRHELRPGDGLGDVTAGSGPDRPDHVLRSVGDRQGQE